MPTPPENIYTRQRRAHEAYQRQLKRVEQFRKMHLPAYNESLQRELALLHQDQHTAQEADEIVRLTESGELPQE
jgi:ClpP class serine protease